MSEPQPPPYSDLSSSPSLPPNLPSPPPRAWNYQASRPSGPWMPFWGQAGFGCLAFFVAAFMGMMLMSMAAGATSSASVMFGVLLIPLAALVAAVIFFRTRFGWKGFLPGVLIAFGLVALLIGACFAIIMVSLSGSSMH